MRAELSVRALHEYDPDLYIGLTGPLCDPYVTYEDLNDLYNYIDLDTMDLEVLYADPEFLKDAIASWSTAMKHSWQCLIKALYKDYEPLENYDRHEEWDDTGTRTDDLTTQQDSEMDSTSDVDGETDSTSTRMVVPFDAPANPDNFINESQTIDHGESTTNGTDHAETISTITNTGTVGNVANHRGRMHGNIGVTTSQQMLQAEIDLRLKNQLFSIISNQFKQRFCLLVY